LPAAEGTGFAVVNTRAFGRDVAPSGVKKGPRATTWAPQEGKLRVLDRLLPAARLSNLREDEGLFPHGVEALEDLVSLLGLHNEDHSDSVVKVRSISPSGIFPSL